MAALVGPPTLSLQKVRMPRWPPLLRRLSDTLWRLKGNRRRNNKATTSLTDMADCREEATALCEWLYRVQEATLEHNYASACGCVCIGFLL